MCRVPPQVVRWRSLDGGCRYGIVFDETGKYIRIVMQAPGLPVVRLAVKHRAQLTPLNYSVKKAAKMFRSYAKDMERMNTNPYTGEKTLQNKVRKTSLKILTDITKEVVH